MLYISRQYLFPLLYLTLLEFPTFLTENLSSLSSYQYRNLVKNVVQGIFCIYPINVPIVGSSLYVHISLKYKIWWLEFFESGKGILPRSSQQMTFSGWELSVHSWPKAKLFLLPIHLKKKKIYLSGTKFWPSTGTKNFLYPATH